MLPEEAKAILESKISEYGRIIIYSPEEKEEKKIEEDIISIPQEPKKNPKEDPKKEKISLSDLSSTNYPFIHVTALRKNFAEIDKLIEEFNSPEWASKEVTRTFYIKEGSLERIALAIASMIGLPPEKIEGLKLKKGAWIQMQLTSPTIDLGNIGAIGKR